VAVVCGTLASMATETQGIDVSHWDADRIGYDLVRVGLRAAVDSGVCFVIAKCTHGVGLVDAGWTAWRSASDACGVACVPYCFPTREHPGADQARFFLATLARSFGPDLSKIVRLAVDVETDEGHPANTADLAHVDDCVQALADATGVLPLLYGNPSDLGDMVPEGHRLAQCPLWLADYEPRPHLPRAWSSYVLWQYTDGVVPRSGAAGPLLTPGLGPVDRNRFEGSKEALALMLYPHYAPKVVA